MNFDNLSPLLNKIQDKSYSLLVARWLAEQFSGDQDRTSALMTALSFAKRCKEQAKTEVCIRDDYFCFLALRLNQRKLE